MQIPGHAPQPASPPPRPHRHLAPLHRDAHLDRVARLTKWSLVGGLVLTGGFVVVAPGSHGGAAKTSTTTAPAPTTLTPGAAPTTGAAGTTPAPTVTTAPAPAGPDAAPATAPATAAQPQPTDPPATQPPQPPATQPQITAAPPVVASGGS